MSWLLAEHEGRGPYNRTAGRVLGKSNNLVFFSFANGTQVHLFRKCAAETSVNREFGSMFGNE